MKSRVVVAVVMTGIVLISLGAAASVSARATIARHPVVPSWAPKKPSAEFVKAARTMKPMPQDVRPYDPLYLPSWELFGSLNDAQMQQFLRRTQMSLPMAQLTERAKQTLKQRADAHESGGSLVWYVHTVRMPFRSLTHRQRQLFDAVAKAWSLPGSKDRRDLLGQLYQIGAKKDLSNVDVGFVTTGHVVSIEFDVNAEKQGIISLEESIGYL